MKKLLFSLLISASFTALAQQSSAIVIVDGNLASSSFVKNNAKNIQSKKTYAANAALPKSLSTFSEVSKKGLVAVNFKERTYDNISLADLNLQNNLDAKNPVLYDGVLVKNTEINILGDVIMKAEVKTIDGSKTLVLSSNPKS